MSTLKECWSRIIQAEDYELHMANVGQAQANALLVRDLVLAAGLVDGAKVVFAGAGPGQMFEFVDAAFLQPFELVFTDINQSFLSRLEERARAAGLARFEAKLDDIEATQLLGPVEALVLVLVLEHVDWKKALTSMAGLSPSYFVLIIQRNPPEFQSMVAPNRELPGSLKEASKSDTSCLIEQAELIAYLEGLGFEVAQAETRPVPDGKAMCGFVFRRKEN